MTDRVVIRATSDLHLTQKTAPWVFAALRELAADAQASKGNADNITVLVGDILNQATTVHMPTYIQLRQILHMMPGMVYVIPGNHDQYSSGSQYATRWDNALAPLQTGTVRVISQPAWGRFGRFFPYTKPTEFKSELDRLKAPRSCGSSMLPILWVHQGFRGAYRNKMSVDRDGVSCLDVPPGHIVISGHYHMPQNLGRIIYCGSPYETSFAEEGQAKGWLRWEDAVNDPIPVRVPFGNLGAPRHFTIPWDPAKGPPTKPPTMRDTDRPRIVTHVTRKTAQAFVAQLQRAGLEGVPILAQPTQGGARSGVELSRMGPIEAVGRYVYSVLGADGTKPDPVAMTEYAEEVGLWAD